MIWKSRQRERAGEITFSSNQQRLSHAIQLKYYEMKLLFSSIVEKLEASISSNYIEICKEMLRFYRCGEELLQNLMNECFNDKFMGNIHRKRNIFDISDKVFKLIMAFDLIKSRTSKVFYAYSEARLRNEDFSEMVDEAEDDRISLMHMIGLPMARLFLSMFSSANFSLEVPFLLGKVSKIHIDEKNRNKLYIFIYLCEIHQWKYMLVFLTALSQRESVGGGLNIKEESLKNILGYFEMMKKQR